MVLLLSRLRVCASRAYGSSGGATTTACASVVSFCFCSHRLELRLNAIRKDVQVPRAVILTQMVSKLDTLLDMFACARDFDLDADYLALMNAQADIVSLYMNDDDN